MAICENTARFSVFLEAEVYRTSGLVYHEAIFAGSIINTTLFRLLMLHKEPRATDNTSYLVEVIRLSLIMWLAEVRRSFGIYPVISTIHLQKMLAILKMERGLDWGDATILKLLTLGVAIVEAVDQTDLEWLGREWGQTARVMGFRDAGEAQRAMNVLWIKPVHGVRFLEKTEYLTLGEGKAI
jgi:hypothetical protein